MSDLTRRLDEALPKCGNAAALFSPQLQLYRVKLRDYCLRLVTADPLRLGSNSLDILWRKGVYDTLVAAKTFKVCKKEILLEI